MLKLREANKHAFQKHTAAQSSNSYSESGSGLVDTGNVAPAPGPHLPPQIPEGRKIELVTSTSKPSASKVSTPQLEKPNTEKLACPGGNLVSYWHATTAQDLQFKSPYAQKRPAGSKKSRLMDKYVTFEPDVGGWNNIRMQMELVIVFAAATGRTLVMPPEQAMVGVCLTFRVLMNMLKIDRYISYIFFLLCMCTLFSIY